MLERIVAGAMVVAVATFSPVHVSATYHVIVIQELFAGFDQAPGAQYLVLRPQTNVQTLVHGQALPTFDATGNTAGPFATFCPTRTQCDLPRVSPACSAGGCPPAAAGNDSSILIATAWARDLFCVTPDLVATGHIPYPDGRVCFGDVGAFEPACLDAGPVDCIAYGQFTGDNGIFGSPAPALVQGLVLESDPIRPNQCNQSGLSAAAVCVRGEQANAPCTGAETDCPGGVCRACADGDCAALLRNELGVVQAVPPLPRNFHGDIGALDGIAGDANADANLDATDVDADAVAIFEAGTRCRLEAPKRGADVNLDTRLNAADVVATVQLVTVVAPQG